MMDEVKLENEANTFTADGTLVIHTPVGQWKKPCKKLIAREFNHFFKIDSIKFKTYSADGLSAVD